MSAALLTLMWVISTSPVATPAGLPTVTADAAAVLTAVADDAAVTEPLPAGGAVTVTVPVAVVPAPAAFDATSRTVNSPAEVNVWAGFRSVDVAPSPKSHAQDVGLPVEVSVNATSNGAWPEVTEEVNDDVGTAGTEPSEMSACQ